VVVCVILDDEILADEFEVVQAGEIGKRQVLYGKVAADALESRQLGESVCGKPRAPLDGQRPDGRAA
jgi:hypothetical protein